MAQLLEEWSFQTPPPSEKCSVFVQAGAVIAAKVASASAAAITAPA